MSNGLPFKHTHTQHNHKGTQIYKKNPQATKCKDVYLLFSGCFGWGFGAGALKDASSMTKHSLTDTFRRPHRHNQAGKLMLARWSDGLALTDES